MHWRRLKPSQRQQEIQSPVAAQSSQFGFPLLGHAPQLVVTPSQVTYPAWLGHAASTAVQVLLPEQLTVPVEQFAVAVQADFCRPPGFLAAKTASLGLTAQAVPLTADGPRIAARAWWERGAVPVVWQSPAADERTRDPARIHAVFMSCSSFV